MAVDDVEVNFGNMDALLSKIEGPVQVGLESTDSIMYLSSGHMGCLTGRRGIYVWCNYEDIMDGNHVEFWHVQYKKDDLRLSLWAVLGIPKRRKIFPYPNFC